MEDVIIGLVGEIRAGKTTVASYLEATMGTKVFRNSAILEYLLERAGLPKSRGNYALLAQALFSRFGHSILARAHLPKIRRELAIPSRRSRIIVIDGIRFLEEIHIYRQFPFFRLLYLSAPEPIRYERAIRLGNCDKFGEGDLSPLEFRALHDTPNEAEISKLAAYADARISNSGTLNNLYTQLNDLITGWTHRNFCS